MREKSWPEETYLDAKIQDLILVSFYNLEKSKRKISFERLIKECFSLFPCKFNFSDYSQWPDARKLDRSLRSLRQRRLISGNPEKCYSLTKAGRRKVLETINSLRQRKLRLD